MPTAKDNYPIFPIIIIDDEEPIITSLTGVLRFGGISNTIGINDSRNALDIVRENPVVIILLDLTMPHISGVELLPMIREEFPDLPVTIITGNTEISIAVDCMKNGAFDYLVKPVESSKLIATVRRAVEIMELRLENSTLKKHLVSNELDNPDAFAEILTTSDKMKAVLLYIEAIAFTAQTVLVSGETGVGKELIARAIHRLSGRHGELIAVNVAGFDDNMFSDTLFGHRKGAFTGADAPRRGLIDAAAGGTLFLDEIGDLSHQSQVKLLRLLESREYLPLGSDVKKKSSARVVVATNKNLNKAVESDGFRRDLFYRLSTHHVTIPPLRERPEDLVVLLEHFARQAETEYGIENVSIPKELPALLAKYAFPGNVRELKSLVYDAVSRSLMSVSKGDTSTLSLEAFRESIGEEISDVSTADDSSGLLTFHKRLPTIKEATELLVDEAMKRTQDKQTLAAQLLGISQQALSKRLKK